MGPGLVEIVGKIPERVVQIRADTPLLRAVAQEGGRDTELTASLLRVAAPASELGLGERQLDQRVRPGDAVGDPLGLGDGGRASVLIVVQPVQQGLAGADPDDIFGGTDLGDDRGRLLVEFARSGEFAALGDLLR